MGTGVGAFPGDDALHVKRALALGPGGEPQVVFYAVSPRTPAQSSPGREKPMTAEKEGVAPFPGTDFSSEAVACSLRFLDSFAE